MSRLETIVHAWSTMTDAPVCIAYYAGVDKPWTVRVASGLDAPVLETLRGATYEEMLVSLTAATIFAIGGQIGDLLKRNAYTRDAEARARSFVEELSRES